MTSSDAALEQLIRDARQWANEDPDPATSATLHDLLTLASEGDAVAAQELGDSFSGTLQFGTAGLRAALGPGPNRMNRVVVRRAAAGLAAFLVDAVGAASPGTRPRAVVGFDARHNSDIFARETAAIFAAAGIEAFLMPAALPTPILAYAVRALDCDGGVMVTASHNPPQDNGYKVYLGRHAVPESGRGAQIVAPYDAEIAAKIDAVGPLSSIVLAGDGWTVLPESIAADYEAAVAGLVDREHFPARDLKIVLTPMHGVGGDTAVSVLKAAGFDDVTLVAEQARPDPDFPTVAFPNPEEPGALDLALAAAEELGADIVLANDPDADRAAVAALDPATEAWRMLRGDEVGALLGAHTVARLAAKAGEAGKTGETAKAGDDGVEGVFANSIVSSRLLSRIAATAGYAHQETLTGFKWISRVPGLLYGYEEALGYCVAPDLVRDKDGISAAVLIAEMAAAAKAEGKTVFDTLDELYLVHGLHASDQLSIRVADLGLLDAMMNRLRVNPPEAFGGSAVEVFTDLAEGSEALPPTDGLLYLTRDQSRVIIRPSGTEPKLKCYLEVIQAVESAAELPAARQAARTSLDNVLRDVREALGL
ncbi:MULTISPECIES: phospho-sugar mutase [Paenarthrobacter]|uniref:Phospho-sugar mutase n=1 Tax=Paenarthrobacter ureafaciens TaxID=37931 RepID=A0AAX3ELD3_PAEUR|nr:MULTISPECIES: phospho-sugar mutase [Paenarthrobacter]NKR11051.1 phosphomannomutase [Arthrobacter sp. M5]NKR17508.1 phosphomannomutase [Arthrobacter sp. M6]OEH64037.1 phosphomannomutase [Arthrobacter sp. D4]OEH64651.1 phosphomannomutase [Arthrobacter sp. D2]MDO5863952.1 phospho-sugar mutase [Paenarthrobacter sp. SD-2]